MEKKLIGMENEEIENISIEDGKVENISVLNIEDGGIEVGNDVVKVKKETKTKYKNRISLLVALDSHWMEDENQKPLCYQLAIKENKEDNSYYTILCVNSKISRIPRNLTKYNIFNKIEYFDIENKEDLITTSIFRYLEKKYGMDFIKNLKLDVILFFYSSILDLSIAFHFNKMKYAYITPRNHIGRSYITKKRAHSGVIYCNKTKHFGHTVESRVTYRVKDLAGLESSGLKELATSVGITLKEPSFFKNDETNILKALLNHPLEFLEYTKENATALLDILLKKVTYLNETAKELGLSIRFNEKTMKTTQGSIANELLSDWLLGDENVAFHLALRKQGIINPLLPEEKLEHVRTLHNELFFSENFVETYNNNPEKYAPLLQVNAYSSLAFSAASVSSFFAHGAQTNAGAAGIVVGGRCQNERPESFLIDEAADIDIVSCYGKGLSLQKYPIGLPFIVTHTHNEIPMTLGDFLKQYGDSLVPNLYVLYVSGLINFRQDLIYSKTITTEKILELSRSFHNKKDIDAVTKKDENDEPHIPGDMVLSRKEIRYGIITHDLLEIIKKAATRQEWKEFSQLKVNVAAFYPKEHQKKTKEEWIQAVAKDKGSIRYSEANQNPIDDRSKAWYAVDLKDYIDQLITKRENYKKKYQEEKDPLVKPIYYALQQSLKNSINCTFGALSSPYFPINNCIVVNNLTARARAALWMMVKALNSNISVTDGTSYKISQVLFLKGNKKPGLAKLSNINLLQNHRAITVAPLSNLDWAPIYDQKHNINTFNNLKTNNLALQHIKNFWSPYNITFPFQELEHKSFPLKISYINKANYAQLLQDKQGNYTLKEFKIRSQDKTVKTSPISYILDEILNGNENPKPTDFTVNEPKTYTLNEFQNNHTLQQIINNEIKYRPGEKTQKTRLIRFNNNHFPTDTIKQYETIKARQIKPNNTIFNPIIKEKGYKQAIIAMKTNNTRFSLSIKDAKKKDGTISSFFFASLIEVMVVKRKDCHEKSLFKLSFYFVCISHNVFKIINDFKCQVKSEHIFLLKHI